MTNSEPIDSEEMDDFVPYSLFTEDTEDTPTEVTEEEEDVQEETAEDLPESTETETDDDYSGIYNLLYEQEIFVDSKEKASLEDIQQGLQKAKETLRETVKTEVLESLPQEFKGVIDYALKGGKNLEGFYKTYYEQKTLDDYDIENDDDQKEIVRAFMKRTTKYTDAKIDSMISRFEDSNSLEQEALDARDELKTLLEQERIDLDAAEQQKQETLLTTINTAVDKSEAIQDVRKSKLKAFLLNPVTRDNNTDTDFNRALRSISKNPEHLVILADILSEYRADKGFSFDNIARKEKSSVVKSLKDKLDSISSLKNSVKGGPPTTEVDNVPWTHILES